MGRVVDRIFGVGVCGGRHARRVVIRGGGNFSGSVSGSGTEWIVGRRSSRRESQ